MKCLVPIPPETIGGLKSEGETGPGYQIVSVELKDGRRFDQVVLSEGCIIAVRGHTEVPFDFQEVASVKVNHNVGISGNGRMLGVTASRAAPLLLDLLRWKE